MPVIDTTNWQTIAWQGITLRVPLEWNIGAIGGDREQGYMRIDSPEMPRVEVKWQHSPGFVNVSDVVDKYIAELKRKPRKGEPEVVAERDIDLVSKRKMRKSSLTCFRWQADTTGHGAGWYCERCERMMLVQVMATRHEDGEALAREIVTNLEDHPREGWTRWATYGLDTAVLDRFELTEQKLMAGLIELHFKSEGEELVVARWGMANVILKSREMAAWARAELPKRHKGVKLSCEDAQVRGHPAVAITGEQVSPISRAQVFVMHCLRKPFAEAVVGRLWHCEDDNKLFYVGGLLDRDNVGLLDEIIENTPCHEPEQRGSGRR